MTRAMAWGGIYGTIERAMSGRGFAMPFMLAPVWEQPATMLAQWLGFARQFRGVITPDITAAMTPFFAVLQADDPNINAPLTIDERVRFCFAHHEATEAIDPR